MLRDGVEIVGPFTNARNPKRHYVRCRVGWGWEVKRNDDTWGQFASQSDAEDFARQMNEKVAGVPAE